MSQIFDQESGIQAPEGAPSSKPAPVKGSAVYGDEVDVTEVALQGDVERNLEEASQGVPNFDPSDPDQQETRLKDSTDYRQEAPAGYVAPRY